MFKPLPFTGSEDIEEWLDAFARYSDYANWDENRRYNAIRALMKDNAAQWLQRQEGLVDLAALQQALIEKYQLQPAQIFQLRQQLVTVEQGNKDVRAFSDEVTYLCHKLGVDEEGQLHAFIKGLKLEIKQQVLRSQPADFAAALAAATAEETAQ